MKYFAIASVLTALIIISGCALDKGELIDEVPEEFCDSIQATYIDTTKAIIDLYCATPGCHNQGSGLGDFTSYETMDARGNILIESGIINRIYSTDPSVLMPPDASLPDTLKAVLDCWAEDGYPKD